ncbi:MAG TPA: phosphodiester glycosidase family protein [Acidimicrobiales bacterium]|nr:phosphodiester glycosidase family protein [Acidimicrobiales bacterium]
MTADRSVLRSREIGADERGPRPHGTPPRHRRRQRSYRRRQVLAAVTLVLVGVLVWVAVSLGGALTNPALGSSLPARFAEWARGHGAASVVNWAENEWYSHHAPRVGGKLPTGSIRRPGAAPVAVSTGPAHLPPPAPIVPFASPAVPGEGQWSPAGRRVGGLPAVYETTLRPDAIHTSYVVGVAWMDTKLLKATLYSGSQIPGGGPYTHTAPIQPAAAGSLVAAFNAGFLMSAANGGYYTDGRLVIPLQPGAASFVVYRNGSSTVGAWGRDVTMTPNVVSVRQNLSLLVQNGQPVPGLNSADTTQWGATLGNAVYVWRSGLGITANGALVYVGGPGLNITDLANLLVRAGAVRAMELDINTDWVNLSTYQPATPTGPATPANGTELLPNMTGTPGRYFASWWVRDFITMSSALGG